ncbi:MAG: RidA family protein [Defluviitaleaceae bacterium]|nr:RidA family protein [Defluviitaleaceae bacterium]MCL2276043.1 RidA family protein [Defluviitaleaceae bacterium]
MKKIINTKNAPAAIGPYSQATVHNGTLYVSGQLPIDPGSGEICGTDIKAQTTLVMQNLKAIVEAAGAKLENILKCTILLTDMAHFAQMNETYAGFFPSDPPARICYQVTALPKGAIVEIDAIVAL